MWGNNFPTHKCVPKKGYMSYKIIGQNSVATLFAPTSIQSNQIEPDLGSQSPEEVDQEEVDGNQIEPGLGPQSSLFEKCGYIKDTNTQRQLRRRSSLSIALENMIKKIIRARCLIETKNYKKA